MKVTKMKNQKLKELSHFKGKNGILVEDIENPIDKTEKKFDELERYSLRNFIKIPKDSTEKDEEKRKKQEENKIRREKLRDFFSSYEIYLEQNEIKLEKIKEPKEKVEEVFTTDIKGNFNDVEKENIKNTLQEILNSCEDIDLSVFKKSLEMNVKKLEKIKKSLKENKAEFVKNNDIIEVKRKKDYIYEYYSSLDKEDKYLNNIEKNFDELYSKEDINKLKEKFSEKNTMKSSVYTYYHEILSKRLSKISENIEIKKCIENNELSLELLKSKNIKILTKSQLIYKYLLKDSEDKERIEECFAYLVETEMKYIIKNLLLLNKISLESRLNNIFTHDKLKQLIKNRLKNKLLDYMGRKGKVKEYSIKESTTFELNEIKKSESELRGFSSAVASASFSYRNIVDKDNKKDILSLKDKDIDQKKLDSNLFKLFFPTIENVSDKDILILMSELKSYIYELRNNTLHFKNGQSLISLLKNSALKIKSLNSMKFKEFDKEYVKIFILEKYNSAGVFDYLDDEKIGKFFEKTKVRFFTQTPKLSPSFNKLYSKFEDYNNLLKLKFKDKNDTKEKVAYKFLLSEIYYNQFLSYFLDEKNDDFKEALQQVIKSNEEAFFSQKTGHSKLDKFKENIKFKNPMQYIAELNSYYSKNKEELTNEEGDNEILIFIRKIFTKGFFNFLSDKKYEEILKFNLVSKQEIFSKEIDELKKGDEVKECLVILNKLKIEDWEDLDDEDKAFYCFLRLLDTKERANLKGFLQKTETLNESDKKIIKFNKVLTLVSLINYKNQNFQNEDLDIFTKLTEFQGNSVKELLNFSKGKDAKENESLYCDDKNLKDFKAIHNLKKYATLNVIAGLVAKANYKITKEEIEKYYEKKKGIEALMEEQEELHKKYINPKKYGKFDRDKYEEVVEKISQYNKLKNKVEFNDLNLIQSILLRILYRTAGYVTMWERDLKFILLTIRDKDDPVEEIFNYENKKNTIYKKGQICKKYDKFLEENKNIEDKLPKNTKFDDDSTQLRNYIAHFNYIPTPKFSLLEVFMKMRELLDYDRKLKNAYLRSIKDIFEEYGFDIEFKIEENKNITIESVISMQVTHLKKGKIINIDRHSKELCNLLKELLKYKG